MTRVNSHGQLKNEVFLQSPYYEDEFRIAEKDLLFVKAADNYVDIHYYRGGGVCRRLLRTSMNRVQSTLDPEIFCRCHRSYLVNLQYAQPLKRSRTKLRILAYGKSFQIPVSATYRKTVTEIFKQKELVEE